MATPCSLVEYPPVDGKGYFVLPGDCLAASMSELVKYKPWEALQGPKECGHQEDGNMEAHRGEPPCPRAREAGGQTVLQLDV